MRSDDRGGVPLGLGRNRGEERETGGIWGWEKGKAPGLVLRTSNT